MNVPPDLMRKIEELEAEKRLVSGVREAVTEIEEILNEEPEPTEEKRLLTGAGEGSERGGRGGTIPPKEHRFKPGQSGNPGGRPKQGVNYFLRKLLTAQDHRFTKQVVESLVKHACKGNQTAMRELLARVEPAGEEIST